jgi:hypothetical protein
MGGWSSTHLLDVGPDVVIKRYRSWEYQQPEREWRALNLLSEHVPGLAPIPVSLDLSEALPTMVMSRLPGLSLEGPVSPVQAKAIAVAIVRVQEEIPSGIVADLPPRAGHPVELLRQVRTWAAEPLGSDADPLVAKTLADGVDWVGRSGLVELFERQGRPVFGTGDGNLGNYLWDGSEVRLVDFEYAGRSDRAYELAEITEHISVQSGLDSVLERTDLDAAETARLKQCRRLLALFWLLRILSTSRGGPGALTAQSARLLDLLD